MKKLIEFDADPQQVLLDDKSSGFQFLFTLNIKRAAKLSKEQLIAELGAEIVDFLIDRKGSISNSIDYVKHDNDFSDAVAEDLAYAIYEGSL